ncbi:MAG: sterol desaturase family protein [Bacteroidota bacterium]
MNINPVILSIPIYFALIGIELLVQLFSKKQLYRLNDALTNISCGITSQLSGIFFKVLSVGAYTLSYEHFAIFTIPSSTVTFITLFIASDFCYYWAHRMSHQINLFWGGHVVHHQSEDYNFSVALRQSSFQVIWTFFFYLPLAILGFSPVDFVLASALVTVYQFWIHTETVGKLGLIEKLFNTPSHHRVHHGRDPKYIDKNHAGVFIIWDKIFGTFQEEEEKPTYGITKPVNSWNPVWVNLSHYADMWNQQKDIKGFTNKSKFLFNPPGWLPKELGGYQSPPPIIKSQYQKFDSPSDRQLNLYVFLQYILALGVTAFFLFSYKNYELLVQLVFIGAIAVTIVNCGALFEMRRWVWVLEKIRVITVMASLILLFVLFKESVLFLIFGVVYGLLSLGWILLKEGSLKNSLLKTTPAS